MTRVGAEAGLFCLNSLSHSGLGEHIGSSHLGKGIENQDKSRATTLPLEWLLDHFYFWEMALKRIGHPQRSMEEKSFRGE